jgi:hypothetical protein
MGAVEKGTYAITAQFTDDAGVTTIPTAATWSLLDMDGNIINSRNAVTISSLATSVTVVLSGNDLALSVGDAGDRRFLVEALYTSSLGSGLPLRKEYTFNIENLSGVE